MAERVTQVRRAEAASPSFRATRDNSSTTGPHDSTAVEFATAGWRGWRTRLVQAAKILAVRRNRRWITIAVLLLTLGLVVHFFTQHPEYLLRLWQVPPGVIALVIALNIPAMAGLAWAYSAMLQLCGKPIGAKENLLLTAYSSIVNFFGPLQSGPGVRAMYLKSRHGVRLRDYTLATLIYYAFFASYSALFFLAGARPWWQTLLAVAGAAGFSFLIIRRFSRRGAKQGQLFALRRQPLIALALAVFLQLACIVTYYFVELRAVDTRIQLSQAISYTGAANFSLFVSLTPDAVGFREAFLVLSQHIHHVSTADILNANIIDRGAYLLYLGLLFLFTLGVHARDRLRIKSLPLTEPKE